MSNRLRFRSGQVELRKLRVDSGTVLEAGDLVYLDTDDVKPASTFAFTTNIATTRANFAAVFLGVCHQPSASGDTADVSIDVSPQSVYEFDVVGQFDERIGDGLVNGDAGDLADRIGATLEVLDVDRRIYVNPGLQDVQYVLVTLGVAHAGRVGMSQFINQHQIGMPG